MRATVAVACSGGRDSLALLHATVMAAAQAPSASPIDVVALHVHHGLSPQADAWLARVQAQCDTWAACGLPVRCLTHRLTGRPARGESTEAWARVGRYAALGRMARTAGTSTVLLAHHRRDQAETFLLQALRGAGVAGLSAMPAAIQRDGITWLRPWLDRSRDAIDAYVRTHGLDPVEDDSNSDARFARNRLRLTVWPVLQAAFADAETSLTTATRWAQHASRVLDELADIDMAACSTPRGLALGPWAALSADRRTNALRGWLRRQAEEGAPATLVERLARELPGTGSATWPFGRGTLRRYRGVLSYQPGSAAAPVPAPSIRAKLKAADTPAVAPMPMPMHAGTQHTVRASTLRIVRAGRHRLAGWGGVLVVTRVTEGGIPLAWLAHLDLREREGGERFQAGFERPARSLKRQYQMLGVPAWERDGPLVFGGGQLLFVPGLGIDARVVGLPGQPQMMLHWQRDASPAR